MSLNILRVNTGQEDAWAVQTNTEIKKLNIPCGSTSALIQLGYNAVQKLANEATTVLSIEELTVLSPITKDAKVLCQGANYRQHMLDSGMNPDAKNFNMFFTKSSASIHGPSGHIIKPSHVSLLDYEVELSLVLAKETHSRVQVTDRTLHEYVAGICIGNDISARDVQIPQMQFHKGKSYRTFCPLGPVLCLLSKEEIKHLNNLDLKLTVNGEVRQQDNSQNLVHKPSATISEFSEITDFAPGDIIMTGTPSGCALALPPPFLTKLFSALPDNFKWKMFIKKQQARTQYLQAGDVVESSIKSPDGLIDLGTQSHRVMSEGVA